MIFSSIRFLFYVEFWNRCLFQVTTPRLLSFKVNFIIEGLQVELTGLVIELQAHAIVLVI